ncbi:MAG: AtpZ/AtpI family protein [Bacteroidales bacterium]|jgi:F0F1-type ATP synthase assembly protein I|nr:AtpZ/AtpI family protein [Bacteroidales bacterium]HPF01476.1 AtpZ/AtpI family protein [Bacteroidales bacterium]
MTKDKEDLKKKGNDFARFSGMAFEMLVIIGGMTWGAVWLDKQTGTEIPWFTIILSPLSVIIAVLMIIKDLNRNK